MAGDGERAMEPGQDAAALRAEAFAGVAARRWSEAAALWERVAAAAPGDAEARGLLILSYREAGQTGEADAVADAALPHFPRDWRIANEWALVPFVTRDWAEGARRWQHMRALFPDSVDAFWRSAAVAEELGEHRAAAAFLAEARRLAGEGGWTLALSAEFHERREQWHEAAMLWGRAAAFPDAGPTPVENMAKCLNKAALFDEVEKVVAAHLARAQATETLLCEQARAASGRAEWRLAAARWQAVVDAFPGNVDAQDRLGDALWHGQVSEGMEQAASPAEARAALAAASDELDTKTLSMHFESLGDNCEFGIFQRIHNAEPIGLYRWGAVAVPLLVEALHARFEGIGEPANTEMSGAPGDEYILRDRRHWLEGHTFVRYNEEQFPKIYGRQTAALRFLADRLLQDLEEPWKIFVYKPRGGAIEAHECRELKRAIDTIGDAPLMCVRVPEDAALVGTVQRMARGLYVGNISRVSPTARKDEIDFAGWETLCRVALTVAREDGYQVGAA